MLFYLQLLFETFFPPKKYLGKVCSQCEQEHMYATFIVPIYIVWLPDIKFHENTFLGYKVVTCEQTQ